MGREVSVVDLDSVGCRCLSMFLGWIDITSTTLTRTNRAKKMDQVKTHEELRLSLDERDTAFARLLSLIPARYYIVDTPEEVSAI
jgi:hypothetical protein